MIISAYSFQILHTEVVWTSPFRTTKMFTKMLIQQSHVE